VYVLSILRFGNENGPDPADTNPFRYCGEYWDDETGTYYLRARAFSPRLGRFTQEDGARDGTNFYIYCANNPILYVDSDGLAYYVYYTSDKASDSDFSKQAEWQRKQLAKTGEEIKMINLNDISAKDRKNGVVEADRFVSEWNKMAASEETNNGVYIFTHGSDRALIFENESSTNAMSFDGKNRAGENIRSVSELSEVSVKGSVNLFGCNTGNLTTYYNKDSGGQNFASALSLRTGGSSVRAFDGNVGFGFGERTNKITGFLGARLSFDQNGFRSILSDNNAAGRNPRGPIQYQNGERKISHAPNPRLRSS
jgi:RHS repeat-associated protein